MFFIGFAAMPFVKFYQSLTKLVFKADEQSQMFVDDISDSSSVRLDPTAEKSNIAGILASSQSSSHIIYN